MHPLLSLPYEIYDIIFSSLPQSSLAQFCLVNQQTNHLCLPHLYRHVHIKIRKQLTQLEKGLQHSAVLRQAVRIYTKRLTITSCQSSYQWLIGPTRATWCQQYMPHLVDLTFCDFAILPVEQVVPFFAMPFLEAVRFRYCNLICHRQPEAYIPMLPDDHFHTSIFQLPVTYTYNYNDSKNDNGEGDDHTLLRAQQQQQQQQYQPSTSIKQLELEWTDFSSMAIDKLISMVPTLTHVSFGANHNRLKNANTTALESLKRHCPLIESLKIALQQIHPPILSHIIIYYGPRQLYHLDIQCHHIDTLKTVAQYANKVKQLVIHSVGQQEVDIKDPLVVANKVMSIVQQCNQLIHMEMISWGIKDIPSVILYAHQRRSNTWLEKASLVLNNELLAEVRNLFIS